MSRFAWTTIGTAAAVSAAGVMMHGWARLGALVGILAVYLTLVGLGVAFIQLRFFCDSICRGRPGRKRVVLTFDDGPDPASTPRVLDVLRQHGVYATFFCIGKNVEAYPELVRRIHLEGHGVGNHTFHHGWWNNFLFGPWQRREIGRCQEAIRHATGENPIYYRSPVGLTNPHLGGALRKLNLISVGWDVRALDRKARDPQTVVERVRTWVREGSIIALHDGVVSADAEAAIVAGIIAALRSQGYALVRLDELAGNSS